MNEDHDRIVDARLDDSRTGDVEIQAVKLIVYERLLRSAASRQGEKLLLDPKQGGPSLVLAIKGSKVKEDDVALDAGATINGGDGHGTLLDSELGPSLERLVELTSTAPWGQPSIYHRHLVACC